nr:MAG TPA: hypothetical protein [Crassvirales sp.]
MVFYLSLKAIIDNLYLPRQPLFILPVYSGVE